MGADDAATAVVHRLGTRARTLATAVIGHPRTLALVGLQNLDGMASANAGGTSWLVTSCCHRHCLLPSAAGAALTGIKQTYRTRRT